MAGQGFFGICFLLIFCAACSNAVPDNGQLAARAGSDSWASATSKARALVKKMTLEEINKILYTYTSHKTSCTVTHGVDRLDYPGLCCNDGPGGVRAVELTNAYTSGLSVAASWNTNLAYDRGLHMGREFKAKGTQVAFAPVVGPLGRVARGGRNWEGFGADPYLAGKIGAETVQGLQKSVIAVCKHLIGNEQERRRSPTGIPISYSSNIDDRTLHEIYMWPFQDTVRANVGSVMCSYNRLNSTYACANPYLLKTLLKRELAFPGFVISDSFAQHSGIPTAAAGLDVALSTGSLWNRGKLVKAVQDGKLPKSRLEDMATRVLASWFKVIGGPNATAPAPGFGYPLKLLEPHRLVDGRDPASKPTILQSAIEGHVLVKNTNNALPLKNPVILSLYGYDANVEPVNYPNDLSFGKWAFGIEATNISQDVYVGTISLGGFKNPPQSAVLGSLITGGGSGAGTPSFVSDPYSAILQQAQLDDTYLLWNFKSLNPPVNPESSACLVFVNDFAAEGYDRPGLADPDSDTLVKNVASKCSNTIVVIHNNGIRVVDAWIRNPNVTAVLLAHTPGQVSGQALVNVLSADMTDTSEIRYGQSSPSGRLPYTIPKKESDFGSLLGPCPIEPKNNPQCTFTERELIDYRRFLAKDIKPRFPFGFGLTYSKFSYSNIAAQFLEKSAPKNPPNPDQIAPGGIKSLFDPIATVTATIANTGAVAAAEVAQLYVQFPGDQKVRNLRGFVKKQLAPGQSTQVSFSLTRRDLSRWDVAAKTWQLQSGTYKFHIGANVEDILLQTELTR